MHVLICRVIAKCLHLVNKIFQKMFLHYRENLENLIPPFVFVEIARFSFADGSSIAFVSFSTRFSFAEGSSLLILASQRVARTPMLPLMIAEKDVREV